MDHPRVTVPILPPKDKVTLLRLRATNPLPERGIILVLRDTGNLDLQRLADRILRQTRAVEPAARRPIASTAAPDVRQTELVLGCAHDVCAGAGTGAPAAAAAGAALVGDIAGRAGLDVVVGNVAAVGGFVPQAVAEDALAGLLAGDLYVGALGVGLDAFVAGAGAGATVYAVGGDGVGRGQWDCGGEGC